MEPMKPEAGDGPSRPLVLAVSVGVALLTLGLALGLGGWAFNYRSLSLHQGRLERLVAKKPLVGQVDAALVAEGARLLEARRSPAELTTIDPSWPLATREEILTKHRQSAQTRIYELADTVYVLYFDDEDVMTAFVCTSLRR